MVIAIVQDKDVGTVDTHIPFPIGVPVGGATVFVLDVEQFFKV